jgi:2-polyprenyl-3-methyl-5-hydroxy-6-metoxy-1,4-benzoquinol methylase
MSEAKLNIQLNKEKLQEIEDQLRLQRHVERYRFIRRFCHGRVADIGCGVGYGSYLISQNPDVVEVNGVEPVEESYNFARKEWVEDNLSFFNATYDQMEFSKNYVLDVATIIEVLEHIEQPEELIQWCFCKKVKTIIATVPAYKTTHFNKHHTKDFSEEDFKFLMEDNGYATRAWESKEYPHPYAHRFHGIQLFNNEVFLGVFDRK